MLQGLFRSRFRRFDPHLYLRSDIYTSVSTPLPKFHTTPMGDVDPDGSNVLGECFEEFKFRNHGSAARSPLTYKRKESIFHHVLHQWEMFEPDGFSIQGDCLGGFECKNIRIFY
ncbi:hypothetical protein AVEN_153059-1 [Araneus ventricosus]|uniref:Uncharacterized protein n=1 Tax=Araneus ventricosus TaxID=182803 RepID=A0A4Y2IAW9_ARAVE|nr:hypothetical protein AVEN_134390-1 [Araneus ventricosus]GBM74880.1 hypothetical protein AVEN_153059-1 [Araneus ventricosus]